MEDAFKSLEGYQPEKIRDGFEVIKDKGLKCGFDYARIEPYTGDKPELKDVEFFSYKLTVLDHTEYTGRCFWKRYNLSDETKIRQLADTLFTLGLTFRSKLELESVAEKLVNMNVAVRAWGWTPEGENDPIQMHMIKGEWQEKGTETKKPAF